VLVAAVAFVKIKLFWIELEPAEVIEIPLTPDNPHIEKLFPCIVVYGEAAETVIPLRVVLNIL